mmetsp:Transcript_26773/g.63700  ORF Transcript_26773/g.63700 Transcript_26773/m.63700 type:complete len:315 (-) Transcript_26773:58-1002(-)
MKSTQATKQSIPVKVECSDQLRRFCATDDELSNVDTLAAHVSRVCTTGLPVSLFFEYEGSLKPLESASLCSLVASSKTLRLIAKPVDLAALQRRAQLQLKLESKLIEKREGRSKGAKAKDPEAKAQRQAEREERKAEREEKKAERAAVRQEKLALKLKLEAAWQTMWPEDLDVVIIDGFNVAPAIPSLKHLFSEHGQRGRNLGEAKKGVNTVARQVLALTPAKIAMCFFDGGGRTRDDSNVEGKTLTIVSTGKEEADPHIVEAAAAHVAQHRRVLVATADRALAHKLLDVGAMVIKGGRLGDLVEGGSSSPEAA